MNPTLLAANADLLADLARPFEQALTEGSAGTALSLSFLAGLATALTPCVYPMIVITVSVFGASQVESKMKAAALSTAFVAGMVVLFSGLGIGVALTGGIFGDELSSPWVAGGIALMLTALALSMFGAFELALPARIQTKLAEAGGLGYRGAFVLGMVSSIIAAPCVGPVLGLLLPWIGTSGDVGFGAACMVAYALGLGTLFWLVGTFALSLPKSGRWMDWVKSFFGIVLIASALYFIRIWIPGYSELEQKPLLLGAAAGAVLAGMLLGAVHLSFSYTSTAVRVRKSLGVLLTAGGILGCIGWVEALPPMDPDARMQWAHDYTEAKERALATGKPLLVDFGAEWCAACGELDRYTFADPKVVAEGRHFITVKVDMTETASPQKDWLEGYGARGLPLVVIHDSKGKESARVTQFVDADSMLKLMKDAR